eukprot:scaffold91755_cov34-Tisochrysis_lutea.AAC.1
MSVRGPDPLGVRRCSHLNSFSLQHTPLSCPLDCTEPTLLDQLLRQLYAFELYAEEVSPRVQKPTLQAFLSRTVQQHAHLSFVRSTFEAEGYNWQTSAAHHSAGAASGGSRDAPQCQHPGHPESRCGRKALNACAGAIIVTEGAKVPEVAQLVGNNSFQSWLYCKE